MAEEKNTLSETEELKTDKVPEKPEDSPTPIDSKGLKKRLILSSISVLLLVLISSFFWKNGDSLYFEDSRLLMDTVITIKVYGIRGYFGMQAAFKKFAEIEKKTSFYDSNSSLAQLNKTGYHKFEPNKQNRDMLSEIALGAKYLCKQTNGYFDPSFAAIHEIYGFHDKVGRLPSEDEIRQALDKCGYDEVISVDNSNNISLASGSMIDFGGIAGGYAISSAKAILKAAGCKAFLIDDAGDIWFEGNKPNDTPWTVSVRDPRDGSTLAKIISKQPLAISTSGDYERFIEVNGKRYGHIMNPKTGKPADYYDSVTVITHDPIWTDVLSTALFAMPPEEAYEWAEKNSVAALFLTKDGKIVVSEAGKSLFTDIKGK